MDRQIVPDLLDLKYCPSSFRGLGVQYMWLFCNTPKASHWIALAVNPGFQRGEAVRKYPRSLSAHKLYSQCSSGHAAAWRSNIQRIGVRQSGCSRCPSNPPQNRTTSPEPGTINLTSLLLWQYRQILFAYKRGKHDKLLKIPRDGHRHRPQTQ